MGERLAIQVVITGRVQGVGFRYWALEAAQARGLDGWVRNRADGAVEALFAGDPAAVVSMLEACRQGPRFSRVAKVEQNKTDEDIAPGFVIKRR